MTFCSPQPAVLTRNQIDHIISTISKMLKPKNKHEIAKIIINKGLLCATMKSKVLNHLLLYLHKFEQWMYFLHEIGGAAFQH